MTATTLPPLSLVGSLDRGAVARATDLLVGLVADAQVGARWDDESSCAGMSVGALTWHLVDQPRRIVEVLSGPAGDDAPITLDEHYAEAAWIQQDLDGPANTGVRTSNEERAHAGGQSAALEAARAARAQLDDALAAAGPTVHIPWTGRTIGTDDFLVSRLMEVVVHSDDLAASLDGVPVPQFPAAALQPVLTLLSDLALRRHGQDALVRTLARPQRAPGAINAF
ncbi:maleylpyruvate isomerase N-terminal domain-containing protein [Cellulomonas alba]|uniref:Maleylpyruvate isomerase N-terminal domain-containing protein n=1 Tax=Cellulomonas alba TaxID=3053467 RepID=A0ABT7SBF8_9CELL|nr:maleylpyruvate isomerase N-terminal domain-containing protein [Cellulomonas alba]MDM7853525.1 maleylpyruvate isomerase N-terminal domain-containing protein [Cellulomonas alba]